MAPPPVKFEYPLALALATGVVPLCIWLFYRVSRERRRLLQAIVAPRLREQLTRSVNRRKRAFKSALFVVALILAFAALARPQFGSQYREVERRSVDFLIGLDLSRSMLAEDLEGAARLKAAKEAIGKLVDSLGEDRVGIIAFAGEAFVAAPVTQDHESVKRNLAALDTKSIAKQGSDLATAIKLAEKTFEGGDFETKALVLVTDGEELQGDAVIAARDAAGKGMSIFTVGVGTSGGARIPFKENAWEKARFAKNEFGREVVTRLNERVLRQIAASGKGFYESLGRSGEGLQNVYSRGLEPLSHGTRMKPSKDLQEQFQWPLGAAVLILFFEVLMNERRKTDTLPR